MAYSRSLVRIDSGGGDLVTARACPLSGRWFGGPESAAAGAEVDVWLRADGTVSTTPAGREYALIAGIVTAAGLMLSGGAVLGTAWYGVRRLTAACNSRRWEREWARVGPDWSGRRL